MMVTVKVDVKRCNVGVDPRVYPGRTRLARFATSRFAQGSARALRGFAPTSSRAVSPEAWPAVYLAGCCFALVQESALQSDTAARQHDDQQRVEYAILQELEPRAKPARDEQAADQAGENEHGPIMVTAHHDQTDDAAHHREDPDEQAWSRC